MEQKERIKHKGREGKNTERAKEIEWPKERKAEQGTKIKEKMVGTYMNEGTNKKIRKRDKGKQEQKWERKWTKERQENIKERK